MFNIIKDLMKINEKTRICLLIYCGVCTPPALSCCLCGLNINKNIKIIILFLNLIIKNNLIIHKISINKKQHKP